MKSSWIPLTLVLAAAWGALAFAPARCAEPPAIGVVEYDKILSDYTAYQEAEGQYDAFRQECQDRLTEAANTRLLNEAEKQELANLKAVAARTTSQTERMQELLGLTDKRYQEWDALRVLPEREESKEARFQELDALLKKANQEVEALKQTFNKQIDEKAKTLMEPINGRIDAALAKVAEREHLIAILDKQSVLYGGKDVTASVLAELNKKP